MTRYDIYLARVESFGFHDWQEIFTSRRYFVLVILLTETGASLYVSWEHACVVQICSDKIK